MLSLIKERLQSAVAKLGLPETNFMITRTARPEFGDFSSNIALLVSKQTKSDPSELAKRIADQLNGDNSLFLVQVAAPGFLNFFCSGQLFSSVLRRWSQHRAETAIFIGKKKINIELVSANPTGSLHLGHARNGAVGDSLARIFAYAGHDVEREYYVNDGGNQIDLLVESVRLRCEEKITGKPAAIPDGGYHGEEIRRVAELIMQQSGNSLPAYEVIRRSAVQHLLDQIKTDLGSFGVTIDTWFSEAAVYANEQRAIKDVLARLDAANKLYKHEGAVFLNTTADGDDKDRVIVKSDGTFSYLLPDIAYHAIKFAKGADIYVNIFGADHYSYITRLKSALRSLGFDDRKLHVVTIQLVRMTKNGADYKMSKRSGTAVGLRELVEAVGVDAARWYMVDKSANTHLEIDVDRALAKDASNPVYYVQYAHARCNQLLANAGALEASEQLSDEKLVRDAGQLLSQMAVFDQILQDAIAAFEPHRLTNYLYELAKIFHAYYTNHKIVDDNDIGGSAQRLAIIQSLKRLLAKGLELVGVGAPARM